MKNRRSIGFTLTELLVVIAVITLLASMLLPALSKAKDKAREIQCKNNERQSGIGLLAYANDFMNYLPAVRPYSSLKKWSSLLWENGYIPEPTYGAHASFVCPSYNPMKWTDPSSTYGEWSGLPAYGPAAYVGYWLNLKKLEPNRIILADAIRTDGNIQLYYIEPGTGVASATSYRGVFHLRHLNYGNGLFVDGHVESVNSKWLNCDARYDYRY